MYTISLFSSIAVRAKCFEFYLKHANRLRQQIIVVLICTEYVWAKKKVLSKKKSILGGSKYHSKIGYS